MFKNYLFFIICLFFATPLFSKQSPVDSLLQLYQREQYDTAKVRDLNNLSEALNDAGLSDSAYSCAMRSIALNATIKGWPRGPYCMTYSYSAISNVYFDEGDFKLSRENTLKALSIAQKAGYTQRVARLIKDVGDTYAVAGDYDRAIPYYENSLKISEALNDRKSGGDCCNNLGNTYNSKGENGMALIYYTKAMKLYKEIDYTKGIAMSDVALGQVHITEEKYDLALSNFFDALRIQEKEGRKVKIASCYTNIGEIYFKQADYSKALEYHLKGLKIKQEIGNKPGIANSYEALGQVMKAKADTAGALNYFKQGLALCKEIGDKKKYASLLIDIGGMYHDQENDEKALAYYQQSMKLSEEIKDIDNLDNVYGSIAKIYIRQKKYTEAETYTNKRLPVLMENQMFDHLPSCYLDMSEIYTATNRYKEAYTCYKLYSELNAKRFSRENTQKLTAIELNYEFEKKQAAIQSAQQQKEASIQAENSRKQIMLSAVITILTLILVIAVLFINRQKLKSQKDKVIFDQQEALLLSEKHKAEEELLSAKKLLDNYTESLLQKSNMIEDFKEEIEKLNSLKSEALYSEKIEQLDSLNKLIILTNDDWDKFKELFEQVYKGFFVRLKDKFPTLTNAEIRLICLMKLNIDTKQMANMLGVSPDTITKTKYRLRKKVNPAEGTDFDIFVQSL